MPASAASVQDYLDTLPDDRRAAIQAVRQAILDNLDDAYEEGVQYGMIGYYVPHRVFPPGYHCDPKQPLPFAALASKKNHLALHLMCIYQDPELEAWFRDAWAKAEAAGQAKKLDMGKACVRFKKLEDVPLGVIAELIRRPPADRFIERYQSQLAGAKPQTKKPQTKKPQTKKTPAKKAAGKAAKTAPASPGTKKTAKKTSKKTTKPAAQKTPAKKAPGRRASR